MGHKSSFKERLVRVACDVSNRLRNVEEISAADVQKAADRYILIDVRPDEERSVSMISGAVTSDQFESSPDTAQGRIPVVYCTAGYRSGVYAQQANRNSQPTEGAADSAENPKILNLRGGILSWCQEGLPLQTPDGQPTQKVHIHGKAWNLLPEGYEAVW